MVKRTHGGTSPGEGHRFGGGWTNTKLEILRRYLEAYTTALKNQPFTTAYIDAFAGTGYRDPKGGGIGDAPLFPDLAEAAPQGLLEGSAKVALDVEPRFDRYIFVERDAARCEQLDKLRAEYPVLKSDIIIKNGEANTEIQGICGKNWKKHRAVLFLDPYGMQVEWETIRQVAKTQAIDLWLLFPLGIGVNRLLPRSGNIPEGWRKRLNLFLGTEDWYDVFYRERVVTDLFGTEEKMVVKEEVEEIGRYFVERLKTVFPGVAPKPRILTNSTNSPLYLFCFAVGSANERARAVALKIANHLLENF